MKNEQIRTRDRDGKREKQRKSSEEKKYMFIIWGSTNYFLALRSSSNKSNIYRWLHGRSM